MSSDKNPDSFKELVQALAKLPGVGPKTAQRYAFYLLHVDRGIAEDLSDSIIDALRKISNCQKCNTLCEGKVCKICTDIGRDPTKLCIVESPSDLLAVEQSNAFDGLYFVLMGKVSFIDGVGPKDLGFERLFSRAEEEAVKEIIVATNFTAEGEATAQAIESLFTQHLKIKKKKLARLARGVPYGAELEYTDLGTIAQAFRERKQEG
ncbi:recombination mediator RecR [Betaproteobacteria bacterium]|nr:recombination mediator RecR [Betaproteobacteria bacterium]